MIITLLDKCRPKDECKSCPFYTKTSKCIEACPTDAIFLLNNKSFSCLTCGQCAEACPNKAIRKNEFGGYYVDRKRCNGCGLCEKACPIGIIKLVEKGGRKFPMGICSMCGACVEVCPYNARVSSYELLNTKRDKLADIYLKALSKILKVDLKRENIEEMRKIKEKRVNIKIDKDKCVGCLRCSYLCPKDTIKPINVNACTLCNLCHEHCPVDAIEYGEVKEGCILCFNCVNICPNSVLKVENFKVVKLKEDKKIKPKNYCINCGLCALECKSGALKFEDNRLYYSPDLCWKCLKCVEVCPQNVRELKGDIIIGGCSLCEICINNCPENAIEIEEKIFENIKDDRCIVCGTCSNVCPMNAIIIDKTNKTIMFKDNCIACENCSIHCPRDIIPNTTGFKKVVDKERSFIRTDMSLCIKCGLCNKACPNECIDYGVIDYDKCEFCGACYNTCPVKAIYLYRSWKIKE
ncbi:polyferredoxin MvhB [Methanocaldococcus villosus KIN24-T80]|uniref:Polyferredoxin MvhB n=1 Tax=Methanocaldococcus villosus KIN24-T80 TaxID=1069083 RepID=N6VRV6_9EURY|nr:4Fe-4S binding protein [Methanocaldococcus villosus]ENN96595.1 polyferredoxin MvhB [Methanocaldococcus villosus KIN24-T80]